MENFNLEKLISEVHKHPCLYAKSSMEYRNKIKRAKSWVEISRALEISEKECMTKWRSIRDRFSRESKSQQLKSGSAAGVADSKFPYMEQLGFLREFVAPRKTTSSVSSRQLDLSVHAEDVDGVSEEFFPNESTVSNGEDLEDIILEEAQSSFSFGDDTFETPTTSSAFTNSSSTGPRTKKLTNIENGFKNFMENMTTLHERRMEDLQSRRSSHADFFKMVSTKLDMLPVMEQEDAKMFYLNYLHDLVKKYNN